MIDRAALPLIPQVLADLGIATGRGKRNQCPIHLGENKQAFSFDDEKGVWFCFRCGIGGDVVELVKRTLGLDFIGALRWLGLDPDFLPAPDPEAMRKHKAREGLKEWARQVGKELRLEFYAREKVITRARQRLQQNPDDEYGWNWLGWALTGHAALEYQLDLIDGKEEQQLQAYREMRAAL